MLHVMKKVHSAELHPDLKKKMYIIFPQKITGGDWNMVPAVLTVRCFILPMSRIVVRTVVPDVAVVNIPSLEMMYLCSMKSTKMVI